MTTADTRRIQRIRLALPGHTDWGCTSFERDVRTPCIGQVLTVEIQPEGETYSTWRGNGIGICQNPAHRALLRETVARDGWVWPATLELESNACRDLYPATEAPPSPADETVPLRRRTLDYLLFGGGSIATRHEAFQWLAEKDGFHPDTTEGELRDLLGQLLGQDTPIDACYEGRQRMRTSLGLPPQRARFRASLTQEGVILASVTWTAETLNPDTAEAMFTEKLRLNEIDGSLRSALYSHDGGDLAVDFASYIDVELSDVVLDEIID